MKPIKAATIAPGWPGISPRWTTSAKSGVGTALGSSGPVWFTTSHGILNEIYYPRVDQACIRDMGFLVAHPDGFFSEEKRDAIHAIEPLAAGVPAFRLTNTCREGRYRIHKEVIADPRRPVVVQRVRFEALRGEASDYRLAAILAPHLNNRGDGNTAWVGDYKGQPMLFASQGALALAFACQAPWAARSVGFVGTSDGWQDLRQHHRLAWSYERAEDGNVALTAEVDLAQAADGFVVAIGFGASATEAGQRAASALWDGFDTLAEEYCQAWSGWQGALRPLAPSAEVDLYRISTAVLRSHESANFPGGIVASLSIPWGSAKGDEDLGGYHLVWPRDLVEIAGGLLAAGANAEVARILRFLAVTQEADGHWPQNMWLDGSPYWHGVQLDEAAFPILLVDLAFRHGQLTDDELAHHWPMVRRAAAFVACNGPVTPQDRWEEDPGYSPFTLAVEIAALLCAADLAAIHEPAIAGYLRETADAWNDRIERWTYARGSELGDRVGVEGFYVRIAPPDTADAASPTSGFVPIKNRPPGQSCEPAASIVSPDALALVRFGLRAADDPRILNTVKVIDALLKVDTPSGPVWRRYNDDGYGEHDDGSAFDGTGVGRGWPLLAAERAHYELAAGNPKAARAIHASLGDFAGEGGLLPEQVWDGPPIAERELAPGKPSGSAMPLAWAHAEYIKLCRSLADGAVFDTPPQTVARYQINKTSSPLSLWRFNHKCTAIAPERILRIELKAAAVVHWSADDWETSSETPTADTGLGLHLADLPTAASRPGGAITFTFFWPDARRWEGCDFRVEIATGEELPR